MKLEFFTTAVKETKTYKEKNYMTTTHIPLEEYSTVILYMLKKLEIKAVGDPPR
jgi:hypothetical protein